jgi:hypothetical protein
MKTALLAALIAAAFTCSSGARAGNLVDVNVIDRDTGSTLPTYQHDGKLYVAGTPGHRYAVRIVNRTAARVMTVLSVDGVNAITGQTADPYQSGYVLEPWQNTEVDGWRKNMSEVAQFNFTALSDSYAAKTGRPNNVGVIGVAVFREKLRPVPIERERDDKISQARPVPAPAAEAPVDTGRAASSAPAGAGAATAQAAKPASAAADSLSNYAGTYEHRESRKTESLGTGHGERETSVVTYTAFEREGSRPNEVDSIWYDSHRNLVARGIIPSPRPIAVEPQAFPNQFVPDPAN